MPQKKKTNEAAWIDARTLARVLDVQPRRLREILADLPEQYSRVDPADGRLRQYHGRMAMEFWADNRQLTRARPEDGDEDFATGPAGPALERWRELRCEEKELDLAERRGQLVNMDDFKQWFLHIPKIIQDAQVRVRQISPECHQLIDEALKNFEERGLEIIQRLQNGEHKR